MSRTARRLCFSLAGFLLAVAVIHAAAWYVISGRIAAAWPEAVASAAQDGWVIEAGPLHRSGWPWRAAVDAPNLTATRPLAAGASFRWTAEHLVLAIAPADPYSLAISPEGAQTVQLAGGPVLAAHASAATFHVALAADRPAELLVQDFAISNPNGGALSIGHLEARFDPRAMTLTAAPIRPTPPLAAPFDGGATLTLRALLNHPVPATPSPLQSATAWRDAGGQLTIPEFILHWPSAEARGTASGTLDATLQPRLAASLRVQGAPEILDAAARAGLLQPGPAGAARAVLQLLALANPGAPVAIPLTLQDGILTIAQFPLARLPAMDWGPP